MISIWKQLKKPILILAPMEDVTDTVFRRIILSCGRPDIFFTEFTNVEGLVSGGDRIVSQRLLFAKEEKPIIAQVWGKDPKHFFESAKRIAAMGFDGIDINMGCPQKSVVKNGCCGALMKNPSLAHEIILATQEGASASRQIPISVKTRIGYATIDTDTWISFLLSHHLDALIVHGRTAKEMSKVPARWDEIGKAVKLRNTLSPNTILIGNGDVESLGEAVEKVATYGVDGVMIGRGIFKNPFLFNPRVKREHISVEQMINVLSRHLTVWQETWKDQKQYQVVKKYFKMYISGFSGAGKLREDLMETKTVWEAQRIIHQFSLDCSYHV